MMCKVVAEDLRQLVNCPSSRLLIIPPFPDKDFLIYMKLFIEKYVILFSTLFF